MARLLPDFPTMARDMPASFLIGIYSHIPTVQAICSCASAHDEGPLWRRG